MGEAPASGWAMPAPLLRDVIGPPSGGGVFRPFADEGAPGAPVLPREVRGMEIAGPRYHRFRRRARPANAAGLVFCPRAGIASAPRRSPVGGGPRSH